MPRDSDIKSAFIKAIELDGRGRQVVTTGKFQANLDAVNHVWTLKECNRWITYYQPGFMELITDDRENRTYALRNMAYVR